MESTTETTLNVTLLEMVDEDDDNSNDTMDKYFIIQSTNPNLTECRPTILKSELTVRKLLPYLESNQKKNWAYIFSYRHIFVSRSSITAS